MVLSDFDKYCRIGHLFPGAIEDESQNIVFSFNKLHETKDSGIKLA